MRLPRIDYPGARHHVMNRGARRQPVFATDHARTLFLALLAELPQRFGMRVHGYAVMPNHYHLMLESVTGDLPRAMRHLGAEFTQRFNRMQGQDGPLFRGRYRNRIVGTDAYWRHLLVYLHLNPVRAGLSRDMDPTWTSHPVYLGRAPRPAWLHTLELQDLFGDAAAYLAHYEAVRTGSLDPPSEFDARKLWSSTSTGTVAIPSAHEPWSEIADALAEVCAVTGLDLDAVLEKPRGRHGNPANWLAAWWLSRGCSIPHGRITKAMGCSHSGVTQRIQRVDAERQEPAQMADWVRGLWEKSGKR
jgi:REP element-mobilizing transposase RayT